MTGGCPRPCYLGCVGAWRAGSGRSWRDAARGRLVMPVITARVRFQIAARLQADDHRHGLRCRLIREAALRRADLLRAQRGGDPVGQVLSPGLLSLLPRRGDAHKVLQNSSGALRSKRGFLQRLHISGAASSGWRCRSWAGRYRWWFSEGRRRPSRLRATVICGPRAKTVRWPKS